MISSLFSSMLSCFLILAVRAGLHLAFLYLNLISLSLFLPICFSFAWFVIYSSTSSQRHNNKDRRNDKDKWKTSLTIFTSHFITRVRKGCVVSYCERELEIEHNCNILTPHSYGRHVVSFLFSWCSTGGLGPTAGCWLSLLHLISIFSGPQTPSGYPRAPRSGVAFPTTPLLQLSGTLLATALARRTQLNYIIVRRPLDLWNRMFDRHQAEITVMQFRGHSLPVHQSMSVSWALPCPISSANFRPRDFLS